MITFKKWLNKNYNKLDDKYQEYYDGIDKEVDVPMTWDEFVENEWDSFDGYVEREEQ